MSGYCPVNGKECDCIMPCRMVHRTTEAPEQRNGHPGTEDAAPKFFVDTAATVASFQPARIITLSGKDRKSAVIDFSGNEVTFSGNMLIDDAAKQFFNAVFGYFAANRAT